MFRWHFYIVYTVTMAGLALPISVLWLHAWHVGAGLKWLEPEPDMLAITVLSIGASALLAVLVTKAAARS